MITPSSILDEVDAVDVEICRFHPGRRLDEYVPELSSRYLVSFPEMSVLACRLGTTVLHYDGTTDPSIGPVLTADPMLKSQHLGASAQLPSAEEFSNKWEPKPVPADRRPKSIAQLRDLQMRTLGLMAQPEDPRWVSHSALWVWLLGPWRVVALVWLFLAVFVLKLLPWEPVISVPFLLAVSMSVYPLAAALRNRVIVAILDRWQASHRRRVVTQLKRLDELCLSGDVRELDWTNPIR